MMWKFLAGLLNDCMKQKAAFLQGVTGMEQPAVKRYRLLKERVAKAVATYGHTDIVTYLCALAYLAHTQSVNDQLLKNKHCWCARYIAISFLLIQV